MKDGVHSVGESRSRLLSLVALPLAVFQASAVPDVEPFAPSKTLRLLLRHQLRYLPGASGQAVCDWKGGASLTRSTPRLVHLRSISTSSHLPSLPTPIRRCFTQFFDLPFEEKEVRRVSVVPLSSEKHLVDFFPLRRLHFSPSPLITPTEDTTVTLEES